MEDKIVGTVHKPEAPCKKCGCAEFNYIAERCINGSRWLECTRCGAIRYLNNNKPEQPEIPEVTTSDNITYDQAEEIIKNMFPKFIEAFHNISEMAEKLSVSFKVIIKALEETQNNDKN